jgi:hypothetical protein
VDRVDSDQHLGSREQAATTVIPTTNFRARANASDAEKKRVRKRSAPSVSSRKCNVTSSKSTGNPSVKTIVLPAQSALLIGRYICKSFGPNGVFVGRIESYEDSLYHVVYDDGDSEDFGEHDDIRVFMGTCFIGLRVHKLLGNGTYRDGVVVAYQDMVYTVRYSDGSLRTCSEERMVSRLVCRKRQYKSAITTAASQLSSQNTVGNIASACYGLVV